MSFLPLHHFSVGFSDLGSMSSHPRHAAGAEVQLAGEAAVAVVAGYKKFSFLKPGNVEEALRRWLLHGPEI